MLRLRLEGLLAAVFAALTVMTWFWPTWIEGLTGADPDGGNGDAEWGAVLVLGVLTLIAAGLAARDYRLLSRGSASSEA